MLAPPTLRLHLAVATLAASVGVPLLVLSACAVQAAKTDAPPPTSVQAAPAAAAPAEGPSSAGCSKDMDCKGNRLCENGQCVAPR